jgi:hypothetical protein
MKFLLAILVLSCAAFAASAQPLYEGEHDFGSSVPGITNLNSVVLANLTTNTVALPNLASVKLTLDSKYHASVFQTQTDMHVPAIAGIVNLDTQCGVTVVQNGDARDQMFYLGATLASLNGVRSLGVSLNSFGNFMINLALKLPW